MVNNIYCWLKQTAFTYPDKNAVVDKDRTITYKEYYDGSIAIANAILQKCSEMCVEEKIPIVVFIEKSYKVLVSFAGVGIAGCYYSPIDVDMPIDRIKSMLEILRPRIIITTRDMSDRIDQFKFNGEIIFFDDILCGDYKQCDSEKTLSNTIDTDLLYVLFTSGSTGVPKGVCISHRSVIDYIDWVTDTFGITDKDSFGNQAPFYFDNSILDIFSCIKTGATLYIIPNELFHQPVKLLEYLRDKDISTIFWVPSALTCVSGVGALKNVDLTKTIKRIMFCGEVMPTNQFNIWKHFLPDVVYANLYGPTEITDACTYFIVDRNFADDDPIPIGYPCKNTEILVLNERDEKVAIGELGELCVRGTSLSRGYYRDFAKTNEVFVQNPLNELYEDKIYRTGDIVKYNDKGELVFISRKDHQIKHLGHRIELGEIETVACSALGITQCCCMYSEAEKRIVMFSNSSLGAKEIRLKLHDRLPDYMIPRKIVSMPNLPLTINGKIDRKKLKEMLE